MKKERVCKVVVFWMAAFFFMLSAIPGFAYCERETLQEKAITKAVFDINKDNPQELLRALVAVRKTSESLARQGGQTNLIVTFRGPAVTCLIDTRNSLGVDEDKEEVLDMISWNIIELKKAGVRLEACSLALGIAGIENSELLSGVNPVENSLVSLIAYQNKGYALVRI